MRQWTKEARLLSAFVMMCLAAMFSRDREFRQRAQHWAEADPLGHTHGPTQAR